MEGKKEKKIAAAAFSLEALRECERAVGYSGLGGFEAIQELIDAGVSLPGRILPIIAAKATQRRAQNKPPPDGWWWFKKAILDPARSVSPQTGVVDHSRDIWIAAKTAEAEAWTKAKGAGWMRARHKDRPGFPDGGYWLPSAVPPSQDEEAA